VALRRNISAPVWVTDLVEVSKDAASLLVCKKNFLLRECSFFVSDIKSGGLSAHLAWPSAPTVRW